MVRFKHKLSDRATAGHWQGLPSRAKTCQDLHRWLRQANLRCGQGESSSRAGQERAWSEREGATVRHTCSAGRRAARRRSPEEPRRARGTQRCSAREGEVHCVCMHPQFFSKNALSYVCTHNNHSLCWLFHGIQRGGSPAGSLPAVSHKETVSPNRGDPRR